MMVISKDLRNFPCKYLHEPNTAELSLPLFTENKCALQSVEPQMSADASILQLKS